MMEYWDPARNKMALTKIIKEYGYTESSSKPYITTKDSKDSKRQK
jgi:hypothetical protein